MVTTTCFPPTEARRYSSFRGPFLSSFIERKALDPRRHEPTCSSMREQDGSTDVTSQRKRIAVAVGKASNSLTLSCTRFWKRISDNHVLSWYSTNKLKCGRCRKRKIRCSGDNGNGQPCTNCKNASYEPCQFLRVSSQEVPDVKNVFSYNIDASRLYHGRGPTSLSASEMPLQLFQDSMMMSESLLMPHRGGISRTSPSGKQCHPPHDWGHTYNLEASVGYTAYPQSFEPSFESSCLAPPYRMTCVGSSSKPPNLASLNGRAAYDHADVIEASADSVTCEARRIGIAPLTSQNNLMSYSSTLGNKMKSLSVSNGVSDKIPCSSTHLFRNNREATDQKQEMCSSTNSSPSRIPPTAFPSMFVNLNASPLAMSGQSMGMHADRQNDFFGTSNSDLILKTSDETLPSLVSSRERAYCQPELSTAIASIPQAVESARFKKQPYL